MAESEEKRGDYEREKNLMMKIQKKPRKNCKRRWKKDLHTHTHTTHTHTHTYLYWGRRRNCERKKEIQ